MPLLRTALISCSSSRCLRAFAENSYFARRISRRFIAGTSLREVLFAVEELNALGISATLDVLGENVDTEAEAQEAAQIYREMIDTIGDKKLDANVSLKLTQMGIDLGIDVAEGIVRGLVQHAATRGTFLRVDMEGSPYTQATINLVRRIHAEPIYGEAVGVVVQAYLYRTDQDVDQLLAEGIRMRLCKGAYLESAEIAFARKEDTDKNYVKLSKRMILSGIFHGLATHDETIINEIQSFAREEKLDLSSFEFQMLYGIRRDLQERLIKEGFRVRVYIPFGTEWYPYFMRRLAERPANLIFIVRNLFRS